MRRPELGKKKAAISLLVPAVLIALYLASGVNYIDAQGTCHTEKISCHGIPVGNQCIGVETSATEFDEPDQCSELEGIKDRCTTARETLCNSSEYSGDEWKETEVRGFSCGEWEEQYPEDVNLKSCGTN